MIARQLQLIGTSLAAICIATGCGCSSDEQGQIEPSDAGPDSFEVADGFTGIDAALDSGVEAGGPAESGVADDAGERDAGLAVDSATTDSSNPVPDSSSYDATVPEPTSQFCGDGVRDPATEECDDGPGAADDSCTSDCRVRDAFVTEPLIPGDGGPLYAIRRTLGSGPHVIATSPDGFGIVYAEVGTAAEVWLQAFDYDGHRAGDPIRVSEGRAPAGEPNAVVAALPGGTYAVAWTDGADGTADVAVRTVDPASRVLGPVQIANAVTSGTQQEPDMIVVGANVVIAWSSIFDVHVRSFDTALSAAGGEEPLPAVSGLQGRVALAENGGTWALAWQANDLGLDAIHVVSGAASWTTDSWLPAPPGDRPALLPTGQGGLLVVFPAGGSGADAAALSGGLRAAVLDVGATGVISSMPLDDPTFEASGAARPRGVKIAEQVFVSWESLSGGLVRSRFAELSTVAGSNLGATTIRDLPAVAGFSDTGNPAIADLPRWSKHVVIGVWEHDSLSSGRPIPDLEYTMRPLPLLTLDGGG